MALAMPVNKKICGTVKPAPNKAPAMTELPIMNSAFKMLLAAMMRAQSHGEAFTGTLALIRKSRLAFIAIRPATDMPTMGFNKAADDKQSARGCSDGMLHRLEDTNVTPMTVASGRSATNIRASVRPAEHTLCAARTYSTFNVQINHLLSNQ